MKLKSQAAHELRRFQRHARACALISQLPDDDLDAAREVVRDFLAMAENAGLVKRQAPVLLSLAGGNAPRRRAIPIDKPSTHPE